MSISPWAFNFFPLLFASFQCFYTWSGILLYHVPAFPASLIQFVLYAVLLVLYCGSRAEVLFYGNFCFLALACRCFSCCFERSPKGFPTLAVSYLALFCLMACCFAYAFAFVLKEPKRFSRSCRELVGFICIMVCCFACAFAFI